MIIHEDIEPILHAQVVLEIVKHSKHNVGTVLKIGIHRCFLYDYALHAALHSDHCCHIKCPKRGQ